MEIFHTQCPPHYCLCFLVSPHLCHIFLLLIETIPQLVECYILLLRSFVLVFVFVSINIGSAAIAVAFDVSVCCCFYLLLFWLPLLLMLLMLLLVLLFVAIFGRWRRRRRKMTCHCSSHTTRPLEDKELQVVLLFLLFCLMWGKRMY